MKKIKNALSFAAIGFVLAGCEKGVTNQAPSHGSQTAEASATAPSQISLGQSQELASIDGKVITEADLVSGLKGRAKGHFFKAKSEYFEAQQNVLGDYLFDYLVELQAKKLGKTSEELLKVEIDGKIKKVGDKDIQKFYDDFKAQASKMNRPIPPLSDDIKKRIQEQLEGDKKEERKSAYSDQLKKMYKVTMLASPPRMDVAVGEGPVRGSKSAPVTIVTFSDFECPYCQRGAEVVEKVMKTYKGKVKLYFRDFPLEFHAKAKPAAVAARCAGEQGKYWEFHDLLFKDQKEWTGKGKDEKPVQEQLVAMAKKLRLKEDAFKTCLDATDKLAKVDQDMSAGVDAGVSGTPAFFINGIPMSGALPFEKFKSVIDEELARGKSVAKAVMP